MNDVMGAKHSTEPPVAVESFSDSQIMDDSLGLDETQDMSGGTASEGSTSPAPSHASGHSLNSNSSLSSGAGVDGDSQAFKGKGKKHKLGKREATNELLDKMIELQAS